jgi:hypothetical protein
LEEERTRQQERKDKPKESDVTTYDEEKMSPAPTDKLRDGLEATKSHGSHVSDDDLRSKAADKPNAQSKNEEA